MFDLSQGRKKICLEKSFDLGQGNTQDDGVVRQRSPSMSIDQGFQMHFIMR